MVSLFLGAVGLPSFPNAVVTPDGPFVKVVDAYGEEVIVKKSALVWMLGSRSQLSKDRTTRVQQGEGKIGMQNFDCTLFHCTKKIVPNAI